MDNISIHAIPALKDNYIWAIINSFNNNVIIVDPGESFPVINFIDQNKLILKAILITHHHSDHTHGVLDLKKKFNPIVYAGAHSNLSFVDAKLKDNEEIKIAEFPLVFKALSIPGHTLDHTAYYSEEGLFSGDTLFSAGCGKVFEGTMEQMYSSLIRLKNLPDTQLNCGHEYTLNNLKFANTVDPTNFYLQEYTREIKKICATHQPTLPSTIAVENLINPFLRCDDANVKKSAEKYAKKALNTEVEVFTILREWKNNFRSE